MGIQPPYLYDAIKTEGPRSPYHEFDPKAVTRASNTPKPRRQKHEGPLVSFNQHPDSYLVMPYGASNAIPMKPSVKKWVKWMRIIQLVLRCLELIAALGLLVLMILIKGVDVSTGWIMRIAPGIAVLQTIYGIYHLSRKPSGRTPASSASYMLFASFIDGSIAPFYAFGAFVAMTRDDGWKTIISNASLIQPFTKCVFYIATVGGGLHLFSLAIGLYLAVTFHKITQLPPDMNPLEDNLTTRHKRNKSSFSTVTTCTSEKRISTPMESTRASGAAYEDLFRPPTIPFFHTRTQSTNSFSTYRSTPSPSRDSGTDLSRQHQAAPSNRYSMPSDQLQRNTDDSFASLPELPYSENNLSGSTFASPSNQEFYAELESPSNCSSDSTRLSSPTKRTSYTEVPTSDVASLSSTTKTPTTSAWFAADSIGKARTRSSPGKKPKAHYQPLHQSHDSFSENISYEVATDYSSSYDYPKPLEANPPTPTHKHATTSDWPLSEMSSNAYGRSSGDIANTPIDRVRDRELVPRPLSTASQKSQTMSEKAKDYGELKPGTPPILVGSKGSRQVSSGNDLASGFGSLTGRRDVSGKIAEEGRGESAGWGARFRKISGL
ncbi:hypothetical protein BUE80_DR006876 [Diplocarpon rosae]|nr:hypothetical protein BUE80_DR006876 [Diplocarpon rosae]